jgi:hypothetical protein
VWCFTPVIPATQEADAGRSQVRGQAKVRQPYLKNKIKTEGLGAKLK